MMALHTATFQCQSGYDARFRGGFSGAWATNHVDAVVKADVARA